MTCSAHPRPRSRRPLALATLTAVALANAPMAGADVAARLKNVAAAYSNAPVGGRLLFEHISLKLTDASGKLVRRRPKDINPISYYFSNCRVLDAVLPAGS